MIGAWPQTLYGRVHGIVQKNAAQRPHQEARSDGNRKLGKTAKLDGNMQEVNTMVSHDEYIRRKKWGKANQKT